MVELIVVGKLKTNKIMNDLILKLCIILPFIFIVVEIVSHLVYGRIIPNKLLNEALDKNIPKGCELNSLDTEIIYIGNMPYISTSFPSFLNKYHVSDVGRVIRFSSAHRRIAKLHKELKHPYRTSSDNMRNLLGID
jgi:hypothetical protein